MTKYIIELEDDIKYLIINGKADNRCYTLVRPVDELEVLNSDYINEHYGQLQDEAYQRGCDEGYKKCLSENDFDQPCASCDDYQRGLDDAANAFKKLYSCGWERDLKAMGFEFDGDDWSSSFEFIIGHYTASEIVEKVKAYEEKKLHIGDEVEWNSVVIVITRVYEDGDFSWCDGISQDGRAFHVLKENVSKTGKHYDIASILEAMQK